MKVFLLLFTLLFVDSPNPTSDKEKSKFEGSWKLVKYNYGTGEDLSEVPEFMTYVKNVTKTHFSWCSYNPEDGKVVGMGGGTYRFTKEDYFEKTDFWYPTGSGIAGTETTFEYSFKGKQWTIEGYIKSLTLDPSTGEFSEIDSTYMIEVWQRIN